MRVVFLGSPPFATSVLEALLSSARHDVVGVVTRPDKPRGRGRKVEESPLVAAARARGIAVLQPERARGPEFVTALRALAPDVLVVASFGEILKSDVLDLPRHGCLNVHASLLPRHRGASPIQAAILAGDRDTGVAIQRMVLALDEGDVVLEERTPIGAHETSGELFDRLSVLGGTATVRALDSIEDGVARYTPQDPAQATYARKIQKEHGLVDWTRDVTEIDRLVRAFTPWPGARTTAPAAHTTSSTTTNVASRNSDLNTTRAGAEPSTAHDAASRSGSRAPADAHAAPPSELTLLDVRPHHDAPATPHAPGTIVATRPALLVQCGRGQLEIRTLKPAGRGPMDARAWLNGARHDVGARLGAS